VFNIVVNSQHTEQQTEHVEPIIKI